MAKARLQRARKGTGPAADLIARLADDDFRVRARLTEKEMRSLDRICAGGYVRNAQAILAGIKLRAEYAYAKPKQEVLHSGGVNIQLVNPYATPEGGGE